MKTKTQAHRMITGGLAALGAAAAFVLAAFQETWCFLHADAGRAKEARRGAAFRIGGMVVAAAA